MTDEKDIVAQAARGDLRAFRALYEAHRASVARLVYRMMAGRRDAVEDLVQEAFLQAFRSLKDFAGQSRFSTWLHRVTVNVVLMHRRAARSRPVLAEEMEPDIAEDAQALLPDEDAQRRERMRAFFRLVDRLPEKKRTVFILHDLEGMAPSDIAKVVSSPVLTVRTRLFYARRELEAMIAEEPALVALGLTFAGKTSDDDGDERGAP